MTKGCDSHSEITTVSSDTSDVTDRKFDLTRNFFDFGRFVWCRVRVCRMAVGGVSSYGALPHTRPPWFVDCRIQSLSWVVAVGPRARRPRFAG